MRDLFVRELTDSPLKAAIQAPTVESAETLMASFSGTDMFSFFQHLMDNVSVSKAVDVVRVHVTDVGNMERKNWTSWGLRLGTSSKPLAASKGSLSRFFKTQTMERFLTVTPQLLVLGLGQGGYFRLFPAEFQLDHVLQHPFPSRVSFASNSQSAYKYQLHSLIECDSAGEHRSFTKGSPAWLGATHSVCAVVLVYELVQSRNTGRKRKA